MKSRLAILAVTTLLAACSKPPPTVTVAPPPVVSVPSKQGQSQPTPSQVAPPPAAAAPASERPPADTPGLSRTGELNLLVGEFINQTGQPPKSIEELVAKKFLSSIPSPGPGKKYVLKVIDQSRAEVIVVNK